ncbi:hypothetical protein ElyMa_002366500, partial [Elysia marginata]
MVEGSVKRSKGLDIEMGCAQRCYHKPGVGGQTKSCIDHQKISVFCLEQYAQ